VTERKALAKPEHPSTAGKRNPGEHKKAVDRLIKLLDFRIGNAKFVRDELYDRKWPEPRRR